MPPFEGLKLRGFSPHLGKLGGKAIPLQGGPQKQVINGVIAPFITGRAHLVGGRFKYWAACCGRTKCNKVVSV